MSPFRDGLDEAAFEEGTALVVLRLLGDELGPSEGRTLGISLGIILGVSLGIILGMALGKLRCAWLGLEEGNVLGIEVGDAVGMEVGDGVSIRVGDRVGFALGAAVDIVGGGDVGGREIDDCSAELCNWTSSGRLPDFQKSTAIIFTCLLWTDSHSVKRPVANSIVLISWAASRLGAACPNGVFLVTKLFIMSQSRVEPAPRSMGHPLRMSVLNSSTVA